MDIKISNASVAPMTAWLKRARASGVRDEQELRRILSMPDYEIEFRRYGEPNLPVCGICFEEAVDFFLHFDEKDFDDSKEKISLQIKAIIGQTLFGTKAYYDIMLQENDALQRALQYIKEGK